MIKSPWNLSFYLFSSWKIFVGHYISNLSQRLDIYKRIADIRTKEHSEDIIDELQDRFGNIPASVMGLIDIALVRNVAYNVGIYEIRQSDTSLLLYIKDVRSEACGKIIKSMPGQAMLNAGNKPYIAIRFPKGMAILDVLKFTFNLQ